jgi:FixJ family two-component response regulator
MTSDNPIVFVVDDDYRIREALSSLIASVGLRVTAYGSAAEFLEAEKPDAPACLVLDLQLPGNRSGRTRWPLRRRWNARARQAHRLEAGRVDLQPEQALR